MIIWRAGWTAACAHRANSARGWVVRSLDWSPSAGANAKNPLGKSVAPTSAMTTPTAPRTYSQCCQQTTVSIQDMIDQIARERAHQTDGLTVQQARADVIADILLGRITLDGADTGTTRVRARIGVMVPITTLAGLAQTPGTSSDRQTSLDAQTVRNLAALPGTLFRRLLTNPAGDNLLEVTATDTGPPAGSAKQSPGAMASVPSPLNRPAGIGDTPRPHCPRGARRDLRLRKIPPRHRRRTSFATGRRAIPARRDPPRGCVPEVVRRRARWRLVPAAQARDVPAHLIHPAIPHPCVRPRRRPHRASASGSRLTSVGHAIPIHTYRTQTDTAGGTHIPAAGSQHRGSLRAGGHR